MKKTVLFAVLLALLLSGCGGEEQQPVLDLSGFAQETTLPSIPEAAQETTERAQVMSMEQWWSAAHNFEGVELEFSSDALEYTGEELAVTVNYWASDRNANEYWNFGSQKTGLVDIGVFLFLDGQLQPCRTAGETEYHYMHTVTPGETFDILTEELYFTPVTGEAGEELELAVMCVVWPDYFLDMGQLCYQHTAYMAGDSALLKFRAAPGEIRMPETKDRVAVVTVKESEVAVSEEPLDCHTYFHYKGDGGALYGVESLSGQELFQFEISGTAEGEYGLVIFVDNQPVSVAEEDRIYLQTQAGKRTMVEVTLDLSDYDGSMVIYALLVPRNCLSGGRETWNESREAYYLSSANDVYDLMGWEE